MACAVNSVCASDNIDNTTIGNDLIQNDVSMSVDEFSHGDILQSSASDNMDIKNSESPINNALSIDNTGDDNKISSVLDSNNVNNITSDNKKILAI